MITEEDEIYNEQIDKEEDKEDEIEVSMADADAFEGYAPTSPATSDGLSNYGSPSKRARTEKSNGQTPEDAELRQFLGRFDVKKAIDEIEEQIPQTEFIL